VNLRFDDRVVLVTGAAHGFGRAIAHGFAALGAHVHACDVNEEGLADTERLADDAGTPLATSRVDVADRDAVRAWVQDAEACHGRLDVVVNNAGGVLGQVGRPVEEVPEEDWRAIYAVNVDGAFHTTAAAAPTFKRQRSGRIVNIASGAGLGVSLTGIQAYASAKAALIGLTRQLAHELGPWGVTVNCIAPGFVRSNPTTERQWQSYGADGQAKLVESIALKRLGAPEDIASGVLFFASDAAGWVTGQTLSIDGGR
jgi:3-oxoacyl-[acyl-carrier protein] reductase